MKNKQAMRNMVMMAAMALMVPAAMLQGCQSKKSGTTAAATGYYTCAMHPQVREDKPGNCPICGMKLIRVAASAESPQPPDTALRYLTEPVTGTVVGSFKVMTPVKAVSNDTIAADGRIGFDERHINTVAARVSGRIVKLYVKYANQMIRKGQPLMAIYSPELLSTQRDLLQTIHGNDQSLTGTLKEKLLHLGMGAPEIQKIVQSGQPMARVTIYSPYSGIAQQAGSGGQGEEASPGRNRDRGRGGNMNRSVAVRNASVSSPGNAPELLNIREGIYVNKGQTVFAIQNIHSTWAILQVLADDLGQIQPGDPVALYAEADRTDHVQGHIDFIPPYSGKDDQTTGIRIYLSRLPQNWKIGTLIHGRIAVAGKVDGWNIPLSAVNLLGTRSVVWVQDRAHRGVFHVREVQTGLQTADSIRVLSGIKPGDQIVENAAYMVDSDSFSQ